MSANFQQLSDRLLDEYLERHPRVARALGLHEFDGLMPDLSRAALEDRVRWARQGLTELDRLAAAHLDEQQRFDLDLLRHYLNLTVFDIEHRRDWESNPMFYWIETSLMSYLTLNYGPLAERLEGVLQHQRQIPALLATARANLRPPFARPVLEVALASFEGQLVYRQNDVARAVETDEVSDAFRREYLEANRAALQALHEFVEHLRSESERSHDNFAIGAEMYGRLLRFSEGVDLPLDQVLAAGEQDLERNLAEFERVARQIDPAASVEEVERRIRSNHPSEEGLVPETEAMLEEIRRFLVEKDLITIPGEIRPLVAPTPPPMRRMSFAMMFTPGPFERATEAYYYVTLPDEDWSAAQKEGWLQTFNYPGLEDISIHEVYPGHYVHMLHAQQAPSRAARVLKFNSTYAEGWAHYAEQMMLEMGYGADRPEMRLAQLDAALKRDCRYVASIKMHTQGMSVDQAIELFQKYGHMAEKPARQEALRGTWNPGYLAYTLGKLMFLRLREDLLQRQGRAFSLKAFHDACVGVGVPPFPLLRRKLLGEDNGSIL